LKSSRARFEDLLLYCFVVLTLLAIDTATAVPAIVALRRRMSAVAFAGLRDHM